MDVVKIVGDALGLSGRRAWSLFLSMATGYLVARLLGPAQFGLLAIFMLIPSLATYGSLGWDQGVMRELLHFQGRGDIHAAQRARATAYTAELILAGVWVAVILAIAWGFIRDPTARTGLLLGAGGVLVAKLTQLCLVNAIVAKDFTLQVRAGMASATAGAMLKVAAAWWFGVVAVFAGMLAAELLGLWVYWRARPLRFPLTLNASELRRLTRIGVPLALLTLLSGTTALTAYLSRSILGGLAGFEVLGLYVFASGLGCYLTGFVRDGIAAYRPHLLEGLANASDRAAVFQLMAKPAVTVAYATAVGGSCMLAFLPAFINLTLPRFVPIIPLLPVFFFGAFLTCVVHLPGLLLSSAFANQQAFYTKCWAAAVGVSAALLWTFTRWGWGLTGAAWASLALPLCVAALALPRTYAYYLVGWRQGARHALEQMGPLAYVALVHAAAGRLDLQFTAHPVLDQLAVGVLALAISCAPLLTRAYRLFDLRRFLPLQYQPSIG